MSLLISLRDYFGTKPHSIEQEREALKLLTTVDSLLAQAILSGVSLVRDPDTKTFISGSRGGQGDGGFRLPTSTTGAPNSSHKEARGVDIHDPVEELDNFIDDFLLESFNLYREHPIHTKGWVHLTNKAPKSNSRTFRI